jgi:hypothetical protein
MRLDPHRVMLGTRKYLGSQSLVVFTGISLAASEPKQSVRATTWDRQPLEVGASGWRAH